MSFQSLNSVQFTGNVGSDPNFNTTANGTEVSNFSLAVSRYNPRAQGDNKNETMWVRVAAFGRLAEFVDKHISKGDLVAVSGELWVRAYTTTNGADSFSVEVTASQVQFLRHPERTPEDEEAEQENPKETVRRASTTSAASRGGRGNTRR